VVVVRMPVGPLAAVSPSQAGLLLLVLLQRLAVSVWSSWRGFAVVVGGAQAFALWLYMTAQ
jgi:hypothetical protein